MPRPAGVPVIALSKPFIEGVTWRSLADGGHGYLPHGWRAVASRPDAEAEAQ
ncbi:MAG: hypothetical protein H6816_08110 [Phycisphaerales bacterium]|nr:hypothetical protein [Phycisphaerales bacterium]